MAQTIGQLQRLLPGLNDQLKINPSSQTETAPVGQGQFSDLLSNLIESVNDAQLDAGKIQNAFLSGEPVELHQVMIKAEEAGLSMDLLLEIRNRLLSGYNEIIRMPV